MNTRGSARDESPLQSRLDPNNRPGIHHNGPILDHSYYLLFIRVLQILVAITYLTLVGWSYGHRGYWTRLETPLIVDVSVSVFTIGYLVHQILTYANRTLGSRIRLAIDLMLIPLWIVAVALMLRKKGKDFREAFQEPPRVHWGLAIGLAFIEIFANCLAAYLVKREVRWPNLVLPGGRV